MGCTLSAELNSTAVGDDSPLFVYGGSGGGIVIGSLRNDAVDVVAVATSPILSYL
jgi:protease II